MFILAAPLTRGTRPARLSSSLMLLSPLMGHSAPVLLWAGSPSWPTGWTTVGVVLAAVVAAVDIAAAAAAVQVHTLDLCVTIHCLLTTVVLFDTVSGSHRVL